QRQPSTARSCSAPLDVWRWRKAEGPCRFLPPSHRRASSSACIKYHGKQRLGLRPSVELLPTTITTTSSMGRVRRLGEERQRLLRLVAGLMSSATDACRQRHTRGCHHRRAMACPVQRQLVPPPRPPQPLPLPPLFWVLWLWRPLRRKMRKSRG
ncbi:unnamed protein product, partial [Laminaria digitata]